MSTLLNNAFNNNTYPHDFPARFALAMQMQGLIYPTTDNPCQKTVVSTHKAQYIHRVVTSLPYRQGANVSVPFIPFFSTRSQQCVPWSTQSRRPQTAKSKVAARTREKGGENESRVSPRGFYFFLFWETPIIHLPGHVCMFVVVRVDRRLPSSMRSSGKGAKWFSFLRLNCIRLGPASRGHTTFVRLSNKSLEGGRGWLVMIQMIQILVVDEGSTSTIYKNEACR